MRLYILGLWKPRGSSTDVVWRYVVKDNLIGMFDIATEFGGKLCDATSGFNVPPPLEFEI